MRIILKTNLQHKIEVNFWKNNPSSFWFHIYLVLIELSLIAQFKGIDAQLFYKMTLSFNNIISR